MNPQMDKYYRIGGITIRVKAQDLQSGENMAAFEVPESRPDLSYTIHTQQKITPLESEPDHRSLYDAEFGNTRVIYNERTAGILLKDTEVSEGIHDVEYDENCLDFWGSHVILRIVNLPRQVIRFGGIFLHASYIVHNGSAILFTAPKQTGKSTQAALWEQYRGAEVVNGDRALIWQSEGTWYAYGSPYCGTSKICKNKTAPIKAIVCLSQTPENNVRRAGVREALAAMLDGCSYETWNREQVSKVMDIIQGIIAQVPFYKLACTPDVRAVEALEAIL